MKSLPVLQCVLRLVWKNAGKFHIQRIKNKVNLKNACTNQMNFCLENKANFCASQGVAC